MLDVTFPAEDAAPAVDVPRPAWRDLWRVWVHKHARTLFWVGVALAVPYLVICNGLAILVVTALLGGGNCG